MLKCGDIAFDIENRIMYVNGKTFNIDYEHYRRCAFISPEEEALEAIAHRVYYDFCVDGFWVNDDVEGYGTDIHERPEFISDLVKMLPKAKKIDDFWRAKSKTYKICGVGVGNFKVIFDATGQTLGYYEFIVYEENIPSALEPADYARALYAEGYGREEIIQDFVNGGMSRNEAIDIVDNCGIDWGEQNLTQNTTSTDCQGHHFDVATCKIPSTCIYCGLTEGEPVECQYINGICHFCGVEDPNSYNNE